MKAYQLCCPNNNNNTNGDYIYIWREFTYTSIFFSKYVQSNSNKKGVLPHIKHDADQPQDLAYFIQPCRKDSKGFEIF